MIPRVLRGRAGISGDDPMSSSEIPGDGEERRRIMHALTMATDARDRPTCPLRFTHEPCTRAGQPVVCTLCYALDALLADVKRTEDAT